MVDLFLLLVYSDSFNQTEKAIREHFLKLDDEMPKLRNQYASSSMHKRIMVA